MRNCQIQQKQILVLEKNVFYSKWNMILWDRFAGKSSILVVGKFQVCTRIRKFINGLVGMRDRKLSSASLV